MKKNISLFWKVSTSFLLILFVVALLPITKAIAGIVVESTDTISVSPTGDLGNSDSQSSLMTPDGRYVSFYSTATNLTPNEIVPTDFPQAYLYDRQNNAMEIVSKSSAGDIGDNTSFPVSISSNGRLVLLTSLASNLTTSNPGQPFPSGDGKGVYLRDRVAGTTSLISLSSLLEADASVHSMSSDGNIIVYSAVAVRANGYDRAYIYNRTTDTTTALPIGSRIVTVSENGNYISYQLPQYDANGNYTHDNVYRADVATLTPVQVDCDCQRIYLTPDGSHAVYVDEHVTNNSKIYSLAISSGNKQLLYDGAGAQQVVFLAMTPDQRMMSVEKFVVINHLLTKQLLIIDLVSGEQLIVASGLERSLFEGPLSADGSLVAYTSLTQGHYQVFVAYLGDDAPKTNGKIVFSRTDGGPGADIFTINPDGTGLAKLTTDGNTIGNNAYPEWSPDGTKIVFVSTNTHLTIMNADGSNQTTISLGNIDATMPSWSPDASKLTFIGRVIGEDFWQVYVVNVDGTSPVAITSFAENFSGPNNTQWSPTGNKIAFDYFKGGSGPGAGSADVFVINANGSGLVNLTQAIPNLTGLKSQFPAWSPDGAKIGYTHQGRIWVMNADGSGKAQLTFGPADPDGTFDDEMGWSPDGSKIVFGASRTPFQFRHYLYLMNSDGTNITQFTSGGVSDYYPNWQTLLMTPTPTPTEEPTPTLTPTPTMTPSPTPTTVPTSTPTPTPVVRQLTSLSPAKVWMGKAVGDAGLKLDVLAEVYKGSILVSSGQTNSVTVGSGIFALADLITVPFNSFSPTSFPVGTQLKIKVSARNACTGSLRNQGTARLWFNDSQANSSFDATIALVNHDYYLRSGSVLSTTVGTGPRQNIDVQAGAKCSAFKPFGTWTVNP